MKKATLFRRFLVSVLSTFFFGSIAYAVVPTGISVSIDEGDFTSSNTINLTLTASGPASIEMQVDSGGGTFGAWVPFVTNTGVFLSGGPGLKTIRVNFRDAAAPGDVAGPASDTITLDQTAPTLTSVSIASDNALNTAFARTGDNIIVSFTADEGITNVSGTIFGEAAVATNVSGNDWTLSLLTDGNETEGSPTFTIDFDDLAGNSGTQVTSITDASDVTFDKTNPIFDSLQVVPRFANNSNKSVSGDGNFYLKNGEKLLFTFNIAPDDTWGVGNHVDFSVGFTPGFESGNFTDSPIPIPNRNRTFTITDPAEGNVSIDGATFIDMPGNTLSFPSIGTLPIIIDQTTPTLSTVSIASNNADTAYAKTNDTITVSFTATEVIENVSATILGETAVVTNTAGNNWTATLLTNGGEPEGTVAFTIDFQDYAGNAGTQVTATTDASSVVYDESTPMVNSVSIASNNTFFTGDAPTTYATSGDDITISLQLNDSVSGIDTITGTLYTGQTGQTSLTFTNTGGMNYAATYTTAGGEQEGTVPFDLTIEDFAGNSVNTTTTTDGSSVIYDTTNPTLPTTVLDLDGVQTNQFKHRTKAEYSWSGHEDPQAGGVNAISGIRHFVVDYVHTTNTALSNELGTTITPPTTSFIPAASILTPDNDPYELSMEIFDKAGNTSGKSVIYNQRYTIGIIGTVTDPDGKPLSGVSIHAAARNGEICLIGQEICGTSTDDQGSYFLLVRDTADYVVTYQHPRHYIEKQDIFIPAQDDVTINPSLARIDSPHLSQGTQEVVRLHLEQTYIGADGRAHPTFLDVLSFSGEIDVTEVEGENALLVSSLSRIVSITSNNADLGITLVADNQYKVSGGGKILSSGSTSGGEGLSTSQDPSISEQGFSALYLSGAARIGTRTLAGNGKAGLRRPGQTREEFRRLNREFMTYEESKAAVAELNQGWPSRVLSYRNQQGHLMFAGYQPGRLPAHRVGSAERPSPDQLVLPRATPGKRRSRPGDEIVSVMYRQEKIPLMEARTQKFRYVRKSLRAPSRIQEKNVYTMKMRVGGRKASLGRVLNVD